MSTSAKPLRTQGYPVKYFVSCKLQPARSDRHTKWGGKSPETQRGYWYQERYLRKWCKALKACSPKDLNANDRKWQRWTELIVFLPLERDKISHAFIQPLLSWVIFEIGWCLSPVLIKSTGQVSQCLLLKYQKLPYSLHCCPSPS